MTARDLIQEALSEIGVQAAGETVSAADEDLALKTLQRILDAGGAARLMIFQLLRTAVAFQQRAVPVEECFGRVP